VAWTDPVDPVSNTVITVAYAVANLLTQTRWLRILTGGTDPPGTGYVVTSDSVSGTSWKTGSTAITGVLGYAPVNKTGDTMSGVLNAPGFQAGASGVNGGVGGVNGGVGGVTAGPGGYNGGSTGVGVPSVLGLGVGASGILVNGATGGVTVTGGAGISVSGGGGMSVGVGGYNGGSLLAGVPSVLGLGVGASGVSVTGLGGINVFGGGGVSVSGGGGYAGGSTTVGVPSVLGMNVGAGGVGVTGAGGVNVSGGGPIQGGNKAVGGDLSVIGLLVGAHGIVSDAAIATKGALAIGNPTPVTVIDAARNITPASYGGGTKLSGVIQVKGLLVGTDGLAVDHQITSNLLHPTPPMVLSSAGKVVNLHADILDGSHASTTPSAGAIPIADASGTLDAWVTPSAGSVPAGVGGYWTGIVATIPAGWTRTTALNGRVPVGAGTTFSQTFSEGSSYGTSWAHQHTGNSWGVSVTGSAVGGSGDVTGANSAAGQSAGTGTSRADDPHTHSLNGVNFSVSASGSAAGDTTSTAWMIPMFCVVWIHKV
jgi:hypothetical protein